MIVRPTVDHYHHISQRSRAQECKPMLPTRLSAVVRTQPTASSGFTRAQVTTCPHGGEDVMLSGTAGCVVCRRHDDARSP